ncbi:MAG: IPT/TIG domain-containing protein, partial [Solirubrobacteraceae bacterium]|nr:IPT/TIG domain-containing protein [Solirubrobacteraceae bacterium]
TPTPKPVVTPTPVPQVNAPVIDFLGPNFGWTGGGNVVNIAGRNLTGATAVLFGSKPALKFTVVSSKVIRATAPAGAAGKVDVSVTTGGGKSVNTANDDYTYDALKPVINKLTPQFGFAGLGGVTTISGENLDDVISVRMIREDRGVNVKLRMFEVFGNLVVSTPAMPAGAYDIVVETPYGVSEPDQDSRYGYKTLFGWWNS